MLSLALAVWTIETLLTLPALSDPQIRPDGRAGAWVQSGEIRLQELPGGKPRTLGEGIRPRWSTDGKKIAYLSARPQSQVVVCDPAGAKCRQVTHAPSPVTAFDWSPDGAAIAYLARDPGPPPDPVVMGRDHRYGRLYWQPLGGGTARLLTPADRHVVAFRLSPAGGRAVFAAQPTPRNQDSFAVDLFDLDLATAREQPLVTQPGRDSDPACSPDGKWVAFHSQAGSENYFEARHVALVPASGGPVRYLTEGLPYDVFRNGNAFSWSSDSRSICFTAGDRTRDALLCHDLASGKTRQLAANVSGAASFTPDLTRTLYLETSPRRPPEIVLLDDGRRVQVTDVHAGLAAYTPLRSEVVRWTSKDGLAIEGVLWYPAGYRPGTRVPLLVELHGGPTGVALEAFPTPRVYPLQVFLEKGYAVLLPNFRGSSNYGAAFRLANARSQGEGDYEDVMTGVDALIERGIADPDRLGVMGWSYGGYLTGAVIARTRRFRAASIGAPAVDWITYYGQSDGPREVLWSYFGGAPWEVPANYERHSTRTRLKDIRTPSLLQVGALDINHNGEIYKALQDLGVPVEYAVYEREGHGFVEPAHIRHLLERNLAWFEQWLAPAR